MSFLEVSNLFPSYRNQFGYALNYPLHVPPHSCLSVAHCKVLLVQGIHPTSSVKSTYSRTSTEYDATNQKCVQTGFKKKSSDRPVVNQEYESSEIDQSKKRQIGTWVFVPVPANHDRILSGASMKGNKLIQERELAILALVTLLVTDLKLAALCRSLRGGDQGEIGGSVT
ncbi:hypothetical protein BGW80DRAFT_1372208 [Lactifluus volemus]|nr:hypothetical protein BGW80DRAFT_1372208 [Lactifluus volemus]